MPRSGGMEVIMNAGEKELQWIQEACPPRVEKSCVDNWMNYVNNGNRSDEKLYKDWDSVVPGSLAPCHLVIAAIQCMRNKGYDVTEAEKYIDDGLKAARNKDGASLQKITAKIYYLLNHAPKDEKSSYWNYKNYKGWEDLEKECCFPEYPDFTLDDKELEEKIQAGWYGQLIGGALGTQIEGYTTANIRKTFGNITTYLREPETYNDDITYELAFLAAFHERGYDVTSEDIAYQWLELISDGYSAEEVALRNLRDGMLPPESGTYRNYYSDWIGAQMRTPIHGMVAPGNPKLAAMLAARDSVISHSNNGMIGGVFNAILVSLGYVEKDMKSLVKVAVACLPKDSEFYEVVQFALNMCNSHEKWEDAWSVCENKLIKDYNWIHAYPNAAAEIIALWFGDNDFDKTANIITMEGQDVDCTAAPVLNVLGVAYGLKQIDEHWTKPLGTEIKTVMRKYQKFEFSQLCAVTLESIKKARK